uniref:Uncharacterized protein n=1 Tax=Aplanochytrium stocchinoi TaxID=215587 RepID=A0A7S3PS07_9STRA|mmetsp:Transcript_15933/g.19765  ORF Transcript_15933/g.19765 Transcript_15933/m.19765 type:complete len:232 (-) Transcript_15933:33-728(-)
MLEGSDEETAKKWQLETERVMPRLANIRNTLDLTTIPASIVYSVINDRLRWRSNLETIKKSIQTMARHGLNENVRNTGDPIDSNRLLSSSFRHPSSREETQSQFASKLDTLTRHVEESGSRIYQLERRLATTFGPSTEHMAQLQKKNEKTYRLKSFLQSKVNTLVRKYSDIDEIASKLQEEIKSRGAGVSDTLPLQRIRKAITQIQKENREMDIKMGVLKSHCLFRANNSF